MGTVLILSSTDLTSAPASIKKTHFSIRITTEGHRSKLLALLGDPGISGIVVEHQDRLARFGAEYLAAALAASGRKLWVIDEGEMRDDLVQDMVEVLTSFCARLYGRRSARNRAQRALEAASQNRP
jgi:predicted site-specific integrase-resolvase